MRTTIRRMSALALVVTLVLSLSLVFSAEGEKILDFSSLNRTPAGQYGTVVADGDNIAFKQNNKLTDVRFVGVSVDLSDGLPVQSVAEAMADELYRNGINLVVFDNVFAALSTQGEFDETKVAAFDVLERELNRKGIYIYLKMFTPAALGVGSVDLFLDATTLSRTQSFLNRFLSHFNLNDVTYANDNTLIAVQYSSDASAVWQNPGENFNVESLKPAFNKWLKERYETRTALYATWNRGMYLSEELGDDEDFDLGTVRVGFIPATGKEALISGTADDWASVTHNARQADFMQFLADQQTEAYATFERFMRARNYTGLLVYGDNSTGPLTTKLSGLGEATMKTTAVTNGMTLTDTFAALSSGVLSGKPFFAVWDSAALTNDKPEAFLNMTLYASLQGWDALVLGRYAYYAYTNDGAYNVKFDTDLWSLCGLYANIYRNRYISEAKNSVDVVFSEADALCESGLFGKLSGNLVYFSRVGNVFLGKDEVYDGDATVAISSGNTSSGRYNGAKAWVLHSAVAYTDQYLTSSDRNIWFNTEISGRTESDWADYVFEDVGVRMSSRSAVVKDSVIDSLDLLSDLLRSFAAYDGKMVEDGIAYSDTNQLAYNMKDGTLTLTGSKVIIVNDSLKDGITVGEFNIKTTSPKNIVVIYTPDNSYLSAGKEYIAYVGGLGASDSGNVLIERSNFDCHAFGINPDGTQGNALTAQRTVTKEDGTTATETVTDLSEFRSGISTSDIPLSGNYALYRIVFSERAIDDALKDREAPEQEPRPNLLLLISLPAAGFLAVAVVIVIINDRRRAKRDEELRISSLEAIKKKQAEHKRKISRFDED